MYYQLIRSSVLSLFLLLAASSSFGLSATALQQGIPSLAPMLEEVIPAVVSIRVSKTIDGPSRFYFNDERIPEELRRYFNFGTPEDLPAPDQRQAVGSGSGVIVDARQGLIITNHHVISDADEITVTLNDARSFSAELLGSDPGTDVALIKIQAEGLTALQFADSDSVRIGDFVVAIGNPFGIGQTVTAGIVSALGRAGLNNENYEDYIQTDAAINLGNSGGALVDMEGRLVGINTAIISGNGGGSDGIGFAVPSNMVASVKTLLERDGEVRRGMLGVQISDFTPALSRSLKLEHRNGALVTNVLSGSAAEAAGIELYDVIVAVNGEPIDSGRKLRNTIGLMGLDTPVKLQLVRNGRDMQLTANLRSNDQVADNRAEDARPVNRPDFNGARLADNANGDGVRVVNVEPQSPASFAGLRADDVILEVNREAVNDVASFNRHVDDSEGLVAVTVLRDNRRMMLLMP